MRSNVCHFFLAWMFASAALAAEVTGPRIDLRVEQPAYAALPIWLDVTVHDACMNKDYPGTSGLQGQFGSALGYDPWAGRAEVKGPDGDIEAAGFAVPGLPSHWMMSKHSPCTAAFSGAAASMHRFPLHIAADLHQPGQYQVRWVIGRPDVLVRSAWVSFSVARSTPAQIETWLTDLLAHVPTDADMIRKTYIPALLVQPDDPRVVRRLLDFTCSPDQRIGDAALNAFRLPLGPDAAAYLVHLVGDGCLTEALFAHLSSREETWRPAVRTALTNLAIDRLPKADTPTTTSWIRLLDLLELRQHDATAATATAAVIAVSPRIIAGTDILEKKSLFAYLAGHRNTPGAMDVIHTLAMQHDESAAWPMSFLVRSGDPAELPTVLARLSGTADVSLGDAMPGVVRDLGDADNKSPEFVAAARVTLRDLLVHAQSAAVRLNAATVLARLGDKDGMQAVLGVLRTGKFEQVAVVLDGLAGPEVPCPEAWAQCHATVSRAVDPNAKWIGARKAAAMSYFSSKIDRADSVAH